MNQQTNEVRVTFNPKIDAPSVCAYYPLHDVLQSFKTGITPDGTDYKAIIEKTSSGNTAEKNNLPVVIFGGEFSHRKASACIKYSGIIVIDFDHLSDEEMAILRDFLSKDPYVMAFWKSPSAKGIKALVKVPRGLIENHKRYFAAIRNYLESKTGVIIDRSGSDVSRACYACYDPNIYYRPDSQLWEELAEEEEFIAKTTTEYNAPSPALIVTSDSEKFEWALKKAQQNLKWGTGRNNSLHILAVYGNMVGLPEHHVINYAETNFLAKDFTKGEIVDTVTQTYYRYSASNNTVVLKDRAAYETIRQWRKNDKMNNDQIIDNYFGHICRDRNDPKYKKEARELEEKITKAIEEIDSERTDGFLFFWGLKENEKTGKVTLTLDYNNFRHWLRHNGFFRYKMNEGSDEIMILCDDTKVVKQIKPKEILPYMTKAVDALPPVADSVPREQLYNFTLHNSKQMLDELRLQQTERYTPQIYRDDKDSCYFIFRNQIYIVTREEIRALDFTERRKYVWDNNILPYNVFDSPLKNKPIQDFFKMGREFEFGEWLFLLCKQNENEPAEVTESRVLELCSIIGYNLHTYKDPANPRATIFTEFQKDTRPHGGTGKSLIVTALSKLRKTAAEDGKNFSLDSSFAFQQVDLSTQLVWIDDLNKNFPFERLFPAISNGLIVEKKHQSKITLSYTESPKFIFTTNYSLKGSSDSFTRRQYIFELSQYFKETYISPYHKYGKRFFDDWNVNDFNTFFMFMMKCAQYYLDNGVQNNVSDEYKLQQLIDTLGGQDIYDVIREHIPFNKFVNKQDFYDKVIIPKLGKYTPKPTTVTKWVQEYAYFYGARYEANAIQRHPERGNPERGHYLTKIDCDTPIEPETELTPEEKLGF